MTVAEAMPHEDSTTTVLDVVTTTAAPPDPRLAQTGVELILPGIVLVAVLLAAGAMLLATRRPGGR
jgi:hypothetical protein